VSPRFVARSVHGLEWVAAAEVTRALPAARDLTLARREVSFALPSVDAGLLALRTVDDVFLRVGTVSDVGSTKAALAVLARGVAALPFGASVATLGRTPSRFDVVASLQGRRTYNRYAVEDAVGSALVSALGGVYVPRGPDAGPTDLSVRVFLRGSVAVAALRVGFAPLHRRAYKRDTGPGTLHPPVASALAGLAGLAGRAGPAAAVLDPFCGDGTVAIESALMQPAARVCGSDLDPARVANARANARRAGVDVSLTVADAGSPTADEFDTVITNPPWNLAVDAGGSLAGSLERFWARLPGRVCLVADESLTAPDLLTRAGFHVGLGTRIRLAGRVSHIVLAARTADGAAIPDDLAGWRRRAIAAGVSTDEGF
jgi:23S rRNA G2445 N2-methylase RlmL